MKKDTLLRKSVAAALLSVSFAAPAAVLASGAASARPVESPNCAGMLESFESALIVARAARQQGDTKTYNQWMLLAGQTKANYNRHCLT